MSVETTEFNDLGLTSTEEIETLPETGGIVGGGLAILNEISTYRPHRRLASRINRLLTTIAVAGLVLNSCAPLQASSSPSSPTEQPGITQPVDTSILPILTDAQETGAMIAQTQEGRAFYNALSVHGVDPSACSPDVLGKLVIEKELPLGEVSDLVTITTDALVNTPEPDHLTTIVCDVKEADDGKQTVSFFFHADTDHTGDGKPDIFIPSQAKVLLPGELIDGVPQVAVPAVGGESPVGSTVTAPDWSPAGGEIPAEIRGLMTVEEQSIRYSLAEKNINTDSVLIHPVFRGSGDDFRMGSGVTNVNQTIAFYPQFDDDGALAWRPDLRSGDRPWHWEQVSLPEGVDGKIEVVFDPDSEAPQFVALTPDESRMIGWFNNLTRQWLTSDGQELTPPPTSTPEPSATPPPAEAAPTSCKDLQAIQPVGDRFLQENGYTSWAEAIAASGITPDDLKTAYSSQSVAFRQAIPVGDYEFPVTIPGFEGVARCAIFAVPMNSTEVKLLPVIVSAVRSDGVVSGGWVRDNAKGPVIRPEDIGAWLKRHKGKAVEVSVYVDTTPRDLDALHNFPAIGVDFRPMRPFYEYALRIGENGLSRTNVWQMMERMNADEPGLMLNVMLGEPDF